jgi:hypothetical protein
VTTLFTETQYFRQAWLWALLLVSSVPAFVLIVAVVVDDAGGLTPEVYPVLGIATLLVWGPLVVFHRARLVTEVRRDGLSVRLFPVHLSARHIPAEAITSCEVVSFSPLGEYGGVGIRHNPTFYRWGVSFEKPKAYVVSGGDGVRIDRVDARPLVVGSQHPEELRAALERLCYSGS